MSIIEQAARRLEELKRSGVRTSDAAERYQSRSRDDDSLRQEPTLSSQASHDTTAANAGAARESRRVELDLSHLAAAGIVTPDAPRSQMADEFRVIKRTLIANAAREDAIGQRNRNLIMVTSALPGEGKTFSAANLAMSIAMEMDHTVLLVDADVARPSLPRVLGIPLAKGLLDLLTDNSVALSDVLLRSNIEKLSILPSGTPHPRATELLASDAMKRLLQDMAERYSDRLIIFDSPPLLVTTEARVLATYMGQVVVVVQAGRTAQSDVKHALATIEKCPMKLLVLNQARTAAQGSYGYGYGYGYGS
jgi:protein-tyrosine kinase